MLARFSSQALLGVLLLLAADPGPAVATESAAGQGTLVGTVLTAAGDDPVAGARIEIPALGLATGSDLSGRFRLSGLPAVASPRVVELRVSHPGGVRAAHTQMLTLAPGREIPPLVIRLSPVVFELEAIRVVADQALSPGSGSEKLDRQQLQRRLESSLAAALDGEAGLARQSMGPGAERPVLRGLGGYRLPILSDQTATGDLSATAPDHALLVDPLLAEAVEIVRGPAVLMLNAGTLAGLVNVRSGSLLEQRLDRSTLQVGGQTGAADRSAAGQLRLGAPLGPLGLQANLSGRRTEDLRTPTGMLRNTAQRTWNGSLGLSHAGILGFGGVAVSRYESDYGIPGGFLGGHPRGVDIEAERTRVEVRGELRPETGPISRIESQAAYSRYLHRELESTGICGVSFGQLTHQGLVRVRLRRLGPLREPVIGVSGDRRDLAMACLSFLPPTVETSLGAFLHDELALGAGRLSWAMRWEGRSVTPARPDSNKAGRIRERTFGGLAAAIGGEWPLHRHVTVSGHAMRTFRPPAIEELFAEGPHLATYAYEIGNADLGAERGTAAELGLAWHGAAGRLSLTVFRNDVTGYIFAADTGELEYGPGEEGYLARYQQLGLDAVLSGAEIDALWHLGRGWELGLSGSWVRGTLQADGRPLPRIPPLNGRLELRRLGPSWSLGGVLRGSAAQRRLGEFEDPTAGHLAGDLWAEWRLGSGGFQQSVVLRVDNLTDAVIRNHLSRLKSIMPEAGRNVSLGYRLVL